MTLRHSLPVKAPLSRQEDHARHLHALSSSVFVVDDDADARAAVAEALRVDGYDVIEASDGSDVLGVLDMRRGQPALVVSDVRMPNVDGVALTERLRARGYAMPILLLTAYVDEEVFARAGRAGATAIFSKPFDLDDLRTAASYFAPRIGIGPKHVRRIRVEQTRAPTA